MQQYDTNLKSMPNYGDRKSARVSKGNQKYAKVTEKYWENNLKVQEKNKEYTKK